MQALASDCDAFEELPEDFSEKKERRDDDDDDDDDDSVKNSVRHSSPPPFLATCHRTAPRQRHGVVPAPIRSFAFE